MLHEDLTWNLKKNSFVYPVASIQYCKSVTSNKIKFLPIQLGIGIIGVLGICCSYIVPVLYNYMYRSKHAEKMKDNSVVKRPRVPVKHFCRYCVS